MPWSRFKSNYEAPPGDRDILFVEAMREAIDQVMTLDEKVFAIGLDADDKFGVFGSMLDMSHPERILGTPISENAMTGVALGAALCGMRPIHVHLRNDFLLVAMDQIVNYVAKWQDMYDQQVKVPLVIRSIIGRGWGCGAQHSQSLHGLFAQIPGLKVVMPSTPYDAKGLFVSAVKEDSPVLFLEHRWLYKNRGNVPEEIYAIPLGKARLLREGGSLTIVASSLAAMDALKACENIDADVDLIDPRTLKPLDEGAILNSVKKTGRLLVIDYDFPFGGFASEVCALVTEKGFASLESAPRRMSFPDMGMPASGPLERAYYPNPEKIALEIQKILGAPAKRPELIV